MTKSTLTRAEKFAARIATLTARIEKDTAELAAVTLESQTSSALSSVTVGTHITARLGRAGSPAVEAQAETVAEDGTVIPAVAGKAATAGTLRYVEAVILATKEEDNGTMRYKIQFGEGFDQDVEIIQASQIHAVTAAV